MQNLDLACSIGGFSLLGLVVVAYGVRVLVRGAARFERVERDKGSALFGASLMQMGYWGLDPIGRALAALGVSANAVSASSLVFGVMRVVLQLPYFDAPGSESPPPQRTGSACENRTTGHGC